MHVEYVILQKARFLVSLCTSFSISVPLIFSLKRRPITTIAIRMLSRMTPNKLTTIVPTSGNCGSGEAVTVVTVIVPDINHTIILYYTTIL